MTDTLIRELLVDVKQRGANSATKAVKQLGAALEDAAAAVELTNEQLAKMPKSLSAIERAARKAGGAVGEIKISGAFNNAINKMVDKMDVLISAIVEMDTAMRKGFNNTGRAAAKMANDITAATEKTHDQLIDLNAAARRAGGGLGDLGGRADRANRALGGTSGAARGAARQFAAMAKSGGGLTILYAAIAANVYVVKAAFDQLAKGDQLNRLMEFGTAVGSMTGVPVQALAKSLQEATNYAVSFEQAMIQASSASAYGFNSEQISQFALVARRASAVLGIDMTDALNRVIKGVSKQEIELLDELGVTIRLNDAYAAYVKVLNAANTGITYNIQNLTTFQKQQAYANAVIAQSTQNFGALDSMLRATPWEEFAANAESALKRVQAAAATYLTPVARSANALFYMSKNMQTANQANDQIMSTTAIDPKNAPALLKSAAKAREDYKKYLEQQKADMAQLKNLQEQRKKFQNDAPGSIEQATNLMYQNVYSVTGSALFETPQYKSQLEALNKIDTQITKLKKESEDRRVAADALTASIKAADAQIAKNPALKDQLNVLGKGSDTFILDTEKLKGSEAILSDFVQFVKSSTKDIASAAGDLTSEKNAKSASAGYAQALNQVKAYASQTGLSLDEVTKKLGLGVDNYKDLEKSAKAMADYTSAAGNKAANALALEQKRAEVLKATHDTQKADIAVAGLLADQKEREINAVKNMLAITPENLVLQQKLTELQTEQLAAQNSQIKNQPKVKDVTAKVVGLEEKLALLKDTSLDNTQYQTAELKLAVQVETERLAVLEKQAHVEKDIYNAKIAQAEAQRELRMNSYSNATTGANNAYNNTMTQSQIQGLGQEATLTNDILATRVKIAALNKAATDNQVVQTAQEKLDLQNELAMKEAELARMQQEKARSRQNAVTSSLGGVGSSTQGMNAEDKAATEQSNNLAYYDQSISKLGALNSAATETAQGIGNAMQQMANYAEGSVSSATVVASVAQSIASAMSMTSANHIAAIDQEIAAEQARDGKSAESQAKIKALENKKVQEQKKAAQKQIAIQTAVAVMMAAANPWPFPAIPMMAAAALAGALSYSQAGTASAPSASTTDNTASYLSLGERDKSVDVSIAANAGELSYVQGARGVGSANNFTPRAEGGDMLPGVSYLMGEHGAEVATPKVPMSVTPTDKLSSGSGGGRPNVTIHVQALDANSFADFMDNHKYVVRDSVEAALNETGTSLNSLR